MYLASNIADWDITNDDLLKGSKKSFRNNVLLLDIGQQILKKVDKTPAIIGFVCDEGVRRNNGRPGAKSGPKEIRKSLAKMAWHYKNPFVVDAGNVQCNGENLEALQNKYGEIVNQLLKNNYFPIGIGGGHEIAYAGYIGIRETIKKHKLGIINFDAHFDIRSTQNNLPNSGTSFYQIAEHCEHNDLSFQYLCLGIQKLSNSAKLFETAERFGVQWEYAHNITLNQLENLKNKIDLFINTVDSVYISLCMDVFNSSHAPGVSATNPFGIYPEFFLEILKHILSSKKVIYFDIAELNPLFDQDNRTAKLVAAIIHNCLEYMHF